MKKNQIIGIVAVVAIIIAAYMYKSYSSPKNVTKAQIKDVAPQNTSNSVAMNANTPGIVLTKKGETISQTGQEKNIKINAKKSSFFFTGYSVGKEHKASFENMQANLQVENGRITGGKLMLDASTVKTGIDALDKHLKSPDFFEVDKYKTITFTSTKVEKNGDETIVTGNLNFRGVTKEISFPAKIDDKKIKIDFLLDTTPYNMKYAGVNKEVKIQSEIVWE